MTKRDLVGWVNMLYMVDNMAMVDNVNMFNSTGLMNMQKNFCNKAKYLLVYTSE
jgi:hypothetical protein